MKHASCLVRVKGDLFKWCNCCQPRYVGPAVKTSCTKTIKHLYTQRAKQTPVPRCNSSAASVSFYMKAW